MADLRPYVPDDGATSEFTVKALILGATLGIIFGAANAYLGLKVGMTVSASIPVAVISMGMLRGLRDMFTLGYLLAFGALTQWVDIRLAFGFVALVLLGLSVTVWTHLNPQRREVCRSSL